MTLPFLTVETVDAGKQPPQLSTWQRRQFLVSTLPEEDVVSSVESPKTRAIEWPTSRCGCSRRTTSEWQTSSLSSDEDMIQDTVFYVRELPGTCQSAPPQFRARRKMKSLQTTRTYADIHILFSTWRYFPNKVNTWNGICSVSSRREIRASNLPKDPKIHKVKGKWNLNFTKLRTQNRYWVRSSVILYCKKAKEDLSITRKSLPNTHP